MVLLASVATFGTSKMEYIFFAGGLMHTPAEWDNAMALQDSYLDISFRIEAIPGDHAELDNYVTEMESLGYDYYVSAARPDPEYTPEQLYWDSETMCNILENKPGAKGLYLPEIKTWSYARSVPLNWTLLEEYFVCAREHNKKVLWCEWGWGWWLIRHDAGYHSTFSEYGDVIVPVWANNDPCNWEWARDDATAASNEYCDGKHGASIQDWYWYELGYDRHDMPAQVVTDFIKENYDNGGRWSQFEYEWDDPEFFQGIYDGKIFIGCKKANLDEVNPVNLKDYGILASYWMQSGSELVGDINDDGTINLTDLAIIAEFWLTSCD
jgi:hypothetical protein